MLGAPSFTLLIGCGSDSTARHPNRSHGFPDKTAALDVSWLPIGSIPCSKIAPHYTSVEIEGQRMTTSQAGSLFGAGHVPFLNVEDTVAAAVITVPLKSRATGRNRRLVWGGHARISLCHESGSLRRSSKRSLRRWHWVAAYFLRDCGSDWLGIVSLLAMPSTALGIKKRQRHLGADCRLKIRACLLPLAKLSTAA